LANSKPMGQIKAFPAREGLFKRNRLLMFVLGGISVYYLLNTLIASLLISLLISLVGGPVTVVPSPLWSLTVLFWLIIIFIIYCFIKLMVTNRRLHKTFTAVNGEEAKTLSSGKPIVKWKPGWQYSPDKLEQWLEQMELQGYNLHRVGRPGARFIFTRGSSRRVKYCVDYQNISDRSYFDIHREAGWKPVYTTSLGGLTRWTIWSQEYNEGGEPPRLYSDRGHLLKHARRIAVTHSCLFLPLIALYIWNLSFMIERFRASTVYNLDWFSFTALAFASIVFGIMTIKTWLYYRRLKKRTANL